VKEANIKFGDSVLSYTETYRHCFDLGNYRFYKDNGDGTALFYKDDEFESTPNPIRIECRLRKYNLESMRIRYA